MPAVSGRAGMLHAEPEAAVRRRALSKVAWRFLPLLTIAYIFNYLDRTSVGFAALTMNRDIGLTRLAIRLGGRVVVRQLQHLRNPEQSDPVPVRCTALDCAHHDHLGHHRCSECFCGRTKQFLHRPPAVGRCGSRVLPRHHVFPRCLVSGAVPRPRVGVVPGGDPGIIGAWRPDLRVIVANGWAGRPGRMAMDVHRRGPACRHHRRYHPCNTSRTDWKTLHGSASKNVRRCRRCWPKSRATGRATPYGRR